MLAALAVAVIGFGLATTPADAQQRPMGASGSSMSSSSSSGAPAKSMPAKKAAAKKGMASESVKAVQAALNKHGAKLKVDGTMGPGTRAALKKYQSANGLKATGRIDDATKAKLGV
jgi:peptidoglycan hydrolase-like protein with peptidoglycan-binding domain